MNFLSNKILEKEELPRINKKTSILKWNMK